MASLHDLHRALFPTARPVGTSSTSGISGTARADRDIEWVRVLKPRIPAFEALEPGDLVIAPASALAAVAREAGQVEELVAAMARTRIPALVLVEDGGPAGTLGSVGRAATSAGLTTLVAGGIDPFALERSVISFLVNRRAELDRRAAELEAQLARYALLGRGLDVQAAAIGAFLGRAVVIEGRKGDALAVHAPADVPSAAGAVARYLARPSTGAALRVDIAAPSGQAVPGGRLVLLGDDPPTEQERIAAERVAGLLGVELARAAGQRSTRESGEAPTEELPGDGPPWVVLVAHQAGGATETPGGGDPDLATTEGIRGELRMLFSQDRLRLRGSSASLEIRAVAAAPGDDPLGQAIATRLADYLGRTVAVSRPFGEPGGRPAAEAAARATLEAADQLPDRPPVVRAERLPAYLLLGNLRNLPDGARQARELLAPILVGRAAAQRERLATLREVLGTPSLAEAAVRLGVHRNTIAYRIQRLEAATGWDLADPDLRLALATAVRLVQIAQ